MSKKHLIFDFEKDRVLERMDRPFWKQDLENSLYGVLFDKPDFRGTPQFKPSQIWAD